MKFKKNISWKISSAIILTSVFCATIWVYAAFTEPTVTPANSNQDFSKNIVGSNNANNVFDSPAVVANANGSIIERLDWIIKNKTK
jgi:hypothetical protein